MLQLSDIFPIFASPSRGNGLRRGAPRERSEVDLGRLIAAKRLDPAPNAIVMVFGAFLFRVRFFGFMINRHSLSVNIS